MSKRPPLSEVDNPWEAIVWLFKYATKEILAALLLLLVGYILAANISYDKEHGWQWKPSININIGK